MKGILKVFALAAALAVFGLFLMLAGFVSGGPSAARQALNYTNLTQRHYPGYVPGWLERALGWADDFEDDVDRWADDFEDGMDDWAEDFEDSMDDWAEDVENWANGYQGGHHTGQGMAWGPGVCSY